MMAGQICLGVRPVLVDGLGAVAAAEGVDEADAHFPGGGDHLLEVRDDGVAVRLVGVERVGVVAERGDRDGDLGELAGDVFGRRDVGYIDVTGAGVAAGLATGARPAGDLERPETPPRWPRRRRRRAASPQTAPSECRASSKSSQNPRRTLLAMPAIGKRARPIPNAAVTASPAPSSGRFPARPVRRAATRRWRRRRGRGWSGCRARCGAAAAWSRWRGAGRPSRRRTHR